MISKLLYYSKTSGRALSPVGWNLIELHFFTTHVKGMREKPKIQARAWPQNWSIIMLQNSLKLPSWVSQLMPRNFQEDLPGLENPAVLGNLGSSSMPHTYTHAEKLKTCEFPSAKTTRKLNWKSRPTTLRCWVAGIAGWKHPKYREQLGKIKEKLSLLCVSLSGGSPCFCSSRRSSALTRPC